MDAERSRLVRRAAVHAALAEPVRLAMVDALALQDVSPKELGARLGLPSNLLAHHLGVLERAGLVVRGRSEADRRRSYVRLVSETLDGLVPAAVQDLARPPRVVFVCTHNSARSQLAAALWARRSPVPAASAGTRPSPHVHPRTVTTARAHGLDLPAGGTAHVRDVLEPGDLVVAVCDNAHEHLDRRSAGTSMDRLHWSVPDPVRADTDAAFEEALALIRHRVGRLATAVDTPAPGRSA
ncbi:ArsR family transcriptional regulator [Actinomadura sp. CNU-125]|uniref:arsenate reductase/protein-tyrosine-phosphatase family protein n=1 Tax=Actinomadura sp. CNU-125 TaxID=1904961 RepID=UPI0009691404|nr:helix-turn-helix domain-containing protein [Actinomadura sp. CNU-125]OLT13326.1 ArsR family transcriptional regulator [Actinomadura sp. CNU-125]